ncbi:MAG: sulfite exporter TauE/SafE family protein [Chloroflexi bacterium]|nr:sulfite exporter TauE/SafE family protein [Chloroflexota bacterium]
MTQPLTELGLASDVLVWHAVILTVVSLGVGVLGGFVGLALGTMRLPALLLMGVAAPTAGGTNILISGLSALTGAVRHLREGRVDVRIALAMGVPAVVGAFIGGFASEEVPEALLLSLAGALVFWQGIELIVRVRTDKGRAGSASDALSAAPGSFTPTRVAAEGAIGLAVGLVGGAVGLILGSIRLPMMIRVLRVDPRIAAGTNLFIGFVMGSVGWVGHAVQGQVDYPLLVLMGSSAMVGSYYGAKLTGRVSLDALLGAMGWVLLVVGALLVWRGVVA